MDRKDVDAALRSKGFRAEEGDHTFYFYYTQAGKRTPVRTKISRGSKYKRLDDNLLAAMARQCRLTKVQFADLVHCPLSREDYERVLAGQQHL